MHKKNITSIVGATVLILLSLNSFAGDKDRQTKKQSQPAPAVKAPAPTQQNQTSKPQQPIGHVFRLKKDQPFYNWNPDTRQNDLITLRRGTPMRLDQITQTPATGNQKSYWNFTILDPKPLAPNSPWKVWIERQTPPKPPYQWLSQPPVVKQPPAQPPPPPAFPSPVFSIVPSRTWGPRCTNFFDEKGNMGAWGQSVYASLDKPELRYLTDETKATDLKTMCPAYSRFDKETKRKLVTYFIASVAMSESGCNPRIRARGPNGTLAGLMQLHLGRERAYGCGPTQSLNPISNLSCGLTMLQNQVSKYGNLFVPRGKTYWQVLWRGSSGARLVVSRLRRLCAI